MLLTELSWRFRERSEGISSYWRQQLGLEIHAPMPARKLARLLGTELRQPDEMEVSSLVAENLLKATDWWGVILHFDPPLILYHPNQSPARFESTIMHELAHLLLEHPPGKLYIATDSSWERDFDEQIEAEAAYLGSCLQIPRRGLQWAIQNQMDSETIAEYYGASIEMVRWRRNACLV